jgi:hypothetical protein
LASLGVMDYSLLVGIHERQYAKANGSFVFRSDRKSSLQDLLAAESALLDGQKDAPALELQASPTHLSKKSPSLPPTFSKQQILNTTGVNALGSVPPGQGTGSSHSQTETPSSPKNSSPRSVAGNLHRAHTNEGFNSFYKMDSRDANGVLTGETYHVGIIDIFTRYSAKKQGEHLYKSLQGNGSTISAVNPRQYQQRFVKFISKITVDE